MRSVVPRLLIVEDDIEFAESLREYFVAKGFNVTHSNDGMFAAGLVRNTKYSTIIIDIKLPGMKGVQLASVVRGSLINKDTPIFLMTGTPNIEDVKRAAHLNIVKLMIKPFKVNELFENVENHLKSI